MLRWLQTLGMIVLVTIIIVLGLASLIGYFYFTGLAGIMIILEFILFTVVMIPLVIGITWQTGYLRTLFFEIEEGNLGFVDSGQANVFTYSNIPGKILRDDVIVNGKSFEDVLVDEEYPGQWEKEKTFIQKEWGLYWVGFKFLNRKVHFIPITKERENPGLSKDMDPSEWIKRDPGVFPTDQLRGVFPRPVLVSDLKFVDNIEANMLAMCNLEVVIPRQFVYVQKGNFGVIASYVRTGVNAFGQRMSADEFNKAGRVEGGDLSRAIVASINKRLESEVGVRLRGVGIPIYNASSDEEEDALKAAEIARLEGLATIETAKAAATASITTAEAAAKSKVIDARAEAKADKLRNKASITDITLMSAELVRQGTHPDIAAQSAALVGRATRYTDKQSPVTTQVEGNGQLAITPPIERKVVLATK